MAMISNRLRFLALGKPDLSGRPRLSLGNLSLTAEVQKYAIQLWHSLDMPDVIQLAMRRFQSCGRLSPLEISSV